MRKIILNLAVSLDGFIEGPNGEIDWLAQDATVAQVIFLISFYQRLIQSFMAG